MKKAIFFLLISSFLIEINAQIQNPRNLEFDWKTDTLITNIDLSEITMVLPRGRFPKIDFPAFIGKEEGLSVFFEKEPVLAVEINGKAKAYPFNMLSMHEMSNDVLSGVPILPTYCPLCNTGIVFDRRLTINDKEEVLEFEVSGLLRKSNMVMFDRNTETWWQQLMGKAIVGDLSDSELKVIPSLIISVEDFFERYPDGKILSRKTGHEKAEERYGSNYYERYDSMGSNPYARYFNPDDIDNRLPAMERIINVYSKGENKVYPFSIISEKSVINDCFNSKCLVLFHNFGTVSVLDEKNIEESSDIGTVTVFSSIIDGKKLVFKKKGAVFKDNKTKSTWDLTGLCTAGKLKGKQLNIEPYSIHFAFSWLSFYPESVVYGDKD